MQPHLRPMLRNVSPLAGKPAPQSLRVDVTRLVAAYHADVPDPSVLTQRVAFGTSGHRGSAFDTSFNEWHVLAITQAICDQRKKQGIDGPLFLGVDTHALSLPACASALEVLAANGVEVMLAVNDEYTPTPAISHAILTHNRGRSSRLADGIVVTPSHNPPDSGGFKYNPPHGGPAGSELTGEIETAANGFLEHALNGVKRMGHAQALRANTTHRHDYLGSYIADLGNVIDLDTIRSANVRIGVDPLGGAGVHFWPRIAEQHRLDLTVVNAAVDPTFSFMTVDWDGRIRMDPSSSYAMQRVIERKDDFDLVLACDTDHDRHGIVTAGAGLLAPNHYLSLMIDYLFQHRPRWGATAAVGKTVVSSRLIDAVVSRLGRRLFEVPVGFKWFAPGLADGSLGFAGEESAGASFLRRDGTVWTTDKDGIAAALLAAEITASSRCDLGVVYAEIARELGNPVSERIDAAATTQQRKLLAALAPQSITATELAGEKIQSILGAAPGNSASIGGIKVISQSGWFAARPSGTEDIYKIYGESFAGADHLQRILVEAQAIVDGAIARDPPP